MFVTYVATKRYSFISFSIHNLDQVRAENLRLTKVNSNI